MLKAFPFEGKGDREAVDEVIMCYNNISLDSWRHYEHYYNDRKDIWIRRKRDR